MVTVDGGEWGLERSDAIIEAEEELSEDGQRMEEIQCAVSGLDL